MKNLILAIIAIAALFLTQNSLANDKNEALYQALDSALFDMTKGYEQPLKKFLNSNAEVEKHLNSLNAELEGINKLNLPSKKKSIALKSFWAKNEPYYAKIFRAAKVDLSQYEKQLLEVTKAFNQKYKKAFVTKKNSGLSYTILEPIDFNAPTEEAEVILTAPFANREIEDFGVGEIIANLGTGNFSVNADGGAFSDFTNKVGLGHSFEVPRGTRKIRVSAKLPRIESTIDLPTLIGSALGQTRAKLVIEGENGVLCRKSKTLLTSRGFLVAGAFDRIESNLSLTCEIQEPIVGQEVVIRFILEAHVESGLALASSFIASKPDEIRVRLNPL